MSPRKSSTSSGRPPRPRVRYLGVELAGEPVPPLSPSAWVARLRAAARAAGEDELAFRLVRSDGGRAIVRLARQDAPRARAAWNPDRPSPEVGPIRTRRTWGTLVGAKAWLRAGRRASSG